MEQIADAIASLECIKPLPDKVFRVTLHGADVLLVNEKPSRSGCQLMTVKSCTAHASDSEWSELCWASSGRTVSSPRIGPSDYNQRSNIESTTIRQRRKPTVEPAQHAIDDDRGAHIFRTV